MERLEEKDERDVFLTALHFHYVTTTGKYGPVRTFFCLERGLRLEEIL